MKKIISYFKESFEELRKVIWPTRKQTLAITISVIVITAVVSIYLGFADYILSKLMSIIIGV